MKNKKEKQFYKELDEFMFRSKEFTDVPLRNTIVYLINQLLHLYKLDLDKHNFVSQE